MRRKRRLKSISNARLSKRLKQRKRENVLKFISLIVSIIYSSVSIFIIFGQVMIMKKQTNIAKYQNDLSALEYMPVFNIKLANNDGTGKVIITNEGFRAANVIIDVLYSLDFIYHDVEDNNRSYSKKIYYYMSKIESQYYNIYNSQSHEFTLKTHSSSYIEETLTSMFYECYDNISIDIETTKEYGTYKFDIGYIRETEYPSHTPFYDVNENVYFRITYEDVFATKHTEYYTPRGVVSTPTTACPFPERAILRVSNNEVAEIQLDRYFDKLSQRVTEYSNASHGILNDTWLLDSQKKDILKFLNKYKFTNFH